MWIIYVIHTVPARRLARLRRHASRAPRSTVHRAHCAALAAQIHHTHTHTHTHAHTYAHTHILTWHANAHILHS